MTGGWCGVSVMMRSVSVDGWSVILSFYRSIVVVMYPTTVLLHSTHCIRVDDTTLVVFDKQTENPRQCL